MNATDPPSSEARGSWRAFDAEAQQLAEALRTQRLTALVGASGLGRTAMLASGVLPLLRRRVDDHPPRPQTRRMAAPVRDRRRAVRGSNQSEVVFIFDQWRDSRLASLNRLLDESLTIAGGQSAHIDPATTTWPTSHWTLGQQYGGARILFVFDHFEQLLESPKEDANAQQFVEGWIRVLQDPGLNANFLVVLDDHAWPRLEELGKRIPGFDEMPAFELQPESARLALEAFRAAEAEGQAETGPEPGMVDFEASLSAKLSEVATLARPGRSMPADFQPSVDAVLLEVSRSARRVATVSRSIAAQEQKADAIQAAEAQRLALARRAAEAEAAREAQARRAADAEARRIAQEAAAAEDRRIAEELRRVEAERAAEAQRVEQARRAAEAEARRVAEEAAAVEARRIVEAQRVAQARRAAEVEAEARRVAEAEARRVAEEAAAAEARRIVEAQRVAQARRAAEAEAEAARAAEARRVAEAEARRVAEAAAVDQARRIAEAADATTATKAKVVAERPATPVRSAIKWGGATLAVILAAALLWPALRQRPDAPSAPSPPDASSPEAPTSLSSTPSPTTAPVAAAPSPAPQASSALIQPDVPSATATAASAPLATASAPAAAVSAAPPETPPPGQFTVWMNAGGSDARFASELARAIGGGAGSARAVSAATQLDPVESLRAPRSLAIAQYDALRAARRSASAPPLRVLAPLYAEEVVFIVRADSRLKFIHDLRGRRVNIGSAREGSSQTAREIYRQMFGTAMAEPSQLGKDEALAELVGFRSIDAMVLVEPQPSAWLASLHPNTTRGLRVLRLDRKQPEDRRVMQGFQTSVLRAGPGLKKGESIPTLTTMTYLAVSGTDDADAKQLADMVRALCSELPRLRADGHPKWRELQPWVNQDTGWPVVAAGKSALKNCVSNRPAPTPKPAVRRAPKTHSKH